MTNYAAMTKKELGFIPSCERCDGSAVVFIQSHPIGRCGGSSAPGSGILVCRGCLEGELAAIQTVLLDVFLGLRPDECEQCGRRIVSLSDLIERLQPLWAWVD